MSTVAITALSDPVAIVHIPISLAQTLTTKTYWTIDRASTDSPEFFNITSNRIEIAIFASLDLIMQEWSNVTEPDVLISTTWRVFEITSGDEGDVGNYDSPHLRRVSAPLAAAGLSILYQSGYFTDFLLVKQSDFETAAAIFAAQGWRVDLTSPVFTPNRFHSAVPIPSSSTNEAPTPTRASPPLSSRPEITVLPSPLACVGFSRTAEQRASETIRKFLVWPERAVFAPRAGEYTGEHGGFEVDDGEQGESESEVSAEVSISITPIRPARSVHEPERPFFSYTRNEDGASLLTEINILRSLFPPGGEEGSELQSGGELSWDGDCDLSASVVSHPLSGYSSAFDEDDDSNEAYQQKIKRRRRDLSSRWTNGQTRTPPPDIGPAHHSDEASAHRHTLFFPLTPGTGCDDGSLEDRKEDGPDQHAHIAAALYDECDSDSDDAAFPYSREIPIVWAGEGFRRPESGKGKKRCLQLDLGGVGDGDEGSYHLEKSGLVTRFSHLLSSSTSRPIRMLYSSTFHTANILVEARDLKRAKRLLEKKRRSGE